MNRFKTSLLTLALAAAAALPALPAAAQCANMSAANVTVALRAGTVPGNSTDRREHIRITQALATQLCIGAVDPDGENSPQIRVEITTDPTSSSTVRSTAVFTVVAIDNSGATGSTLRAEVWGRSSSTDNNNGLRKLFPTATGASSITGARATIYRVAPAKTVTVEYASSGRLNPSTVQHYNEPANNGSGRHFEEYVQIGSEHDVAILVPHGGDIETDISDHLWRIDAGVDAGTEEQADIWEGYGEWGNNETSRRWHITSDAFNGASFPGLQQLIAQAPYTYGVSVHGFTGRRLTDSGSDAFYGIVLGGNGNQHEKCYIARGIQDELDLVGRRTDVAISIFYRVSGAIQSTLILDGDSRGLSNVDDLRGLDNDNIVNRLAPNADGLATFGAFQLELSKELRDDAELLAAVMDGIGESLGELAANPAVANNACTTLLFP
jgi:phage replication-related protein YjqB (UPF0714/DUF867 family)